MVGCKTGNIVVARTRGVNAEKIEEVVSGNNKFAFDLYDEYKSSDENILFSPYVISNALAMTHEGARGQTAQEIQSVLYLPKKDIRRPAYAKIFNSLRKRKKYEISTANAIWVQKDYTLTNEYSKVSVRYYGGRTENVNFAENNTKRKLDRFIEGETSGYIKEIIPEKSIGPKTKMVLTNAIYFNFILSDNIYRKNTSKKEFVTLDNSKVDVPMMSLTGIEANLKFGENKDIQIIKLPYKNKVVLTYFAPNMQIFELPYGNKTLSTYIILPKQGLAEVESKLNPKNFKLWKQMMKKQDINIYIPRFELESDQSMIPALKNMGMSNALSENADFSGIDGSKNLFINDIFHKVLINFNETGITPVKFAPIQSNTTSNRSVTTFNADHAFLFIIQDEKTGLILLMGRVSDPS
ncbi:MAG: hypothetical protein MAG795_00712 [Candidatus Woesearchaeota archaeon]|nr:hypothetical protein [Candidatus Woesearchaeota archaeon]